MKFGLLEKPYRNTVQVYLDAQKTNGTLVRFSPFCAVSGGGITTRGFLTEGDQRTNKNMLKSTGFIDTQGDNMMWCGVGAILIWNQMDFGIRSLGICPKHLPSYILSYQ